MKKIFLTVLILFISVNIFAQENAQKIDELVSKYAENGIFNGSVLVAQNGNILFEKGYGYADREQKTLNTPETKFRLASITKQFTAMLIMQLVQQGKLNLESKVSDYLSYYRKDNGDKITIHNLLTHTGGVPNYTNEEFMKNHLDKAISGKDLIITYGSGDLDFEPGSKYNYSNTGYVMLGAIIEQVTGKTYETVLKEQILDPLGMSNSGYEHNEIKMSNQAIGYDNLYGEVSVAKYIDMSIPFSAGSMYSTVEDLYKWDRALYTDKLISNELKQKIYTPFLNNYGYGWAIVKANTGNGEKLIYTHSGGINGFNTNIMRVVSDDLVIIVLSNYANGQTQRISNEISKIIYGIPYKFPKKSVSNVLVSTGKTKSIKEGIAEAKEQAKNKDEYTINEDEINLIGYNFMQEDKLDDAIEIFKFNVEMFPQSSNVYDSLGEAYMKKGDKENALLNYKKSVEIDPKNVNGKKMIDKLEGK